MNSGGTESGIELADLIGQVRDELALAMREGRASEGPDQFKFELGDVELELEIAIEKSHKPDAKVRIVVVDVNYGYENTKKSTNRIKLTMQPRLPGQPARRPWVSGSPESGEE